MSSGRDPFSFEVVEEFCEELGGFVVRDDLVPGGTKTRFIHTLFEEFDELVYASPCEGGAQTALAITASILHKKFTLFVAARIKPHQRVALSKRLGANVVEIRPGYLSCVQSRAVDYENHEYFIKNNLGISNLKFGLGSKTAIDTIADAASRIKRPKELWFAAGSGTLARGLAKAWPQVPRFAVQVGHALSRAEVGGATIVRSPLRFSDEEKAACPFPSDPHYDAKAYHECLRHRRGQGVTFWNVAGPASSYEPPYNI